MGFHALFHKVVLLLVTGVGIGYYPRGFQEHSVRYCHPVDAALNRIALSNLFLATMLLIEASAGAVWLCTQFAGMLN